MATADTVGSTCTCIEDNACGDASSAARRRRKEIRRIKLMASSGKFTLPLCKRTRSNGTDLLSLKGEEKPKPPSAKPDCSLIMKPSLNADDGEDKMFNSSTGEALNRPSGHQQKGSSILTSLTWDSTSPLVLAPNSSGEDEGINCGNESTSSGSSIISESITTTLGSNEADAGSTMTGTSGSSGSALDLLRAYGQGEVVFNILSVPEACNDRQTSLTTRDRLDSNEITARATTRGCVDSLYSDRCPPHGLVSVCGRRREMEDAVAAIPTFMSLPRGAVRCNCQLPHQRMSDNAPLHFFGVYDGHGGAQVASFA
jgi:hypothetical protein